MSQPEDLSSEEEQVRRLLADARHGAPLPDDVAARLDAVLADLRDEDPEAPVPAVVTQRPTDLAAARRRHHVRSWLVAAAAVVVVGVGINQVVQMDGSGGDADGGSSADSAASGDRVQRPGADDRADGAAGGDQGPPAATEPGEMTSLPAPVRLDPDRFGAQVTRLRDRSGPAGKDASADSLREDSDLYSAQRATCPSQGWVRGRGVPVRYDRQPGVLVFRQVHGDTQVVDLFLCGSDHPERSITLPAP